MLKILILAWRDIRHPAHGGSEEYLHQVAKRLVQTGHQVTFFTSSHPGGSLPKEEIDGVKIIRRGNKFTVYLWAFWYFLRKFKPENFDIIIDQHNGVSFFAPLYTSIPVISLVHHLSFDQWFDEEKGLIAQGGYWIEKYLYPLAYRHCDFVAVSAHTKQELISKLGVDPQYVSVIRPGISSCYKTKAKTQYPSIIYVGRLKKYKKIDLLIRSLLRLKYFFPNLALHIVGSGNYKDALIKLANNLGLANSIIFHGFVSDELKGDLLSSAWVMANPSNHEGWGISVIEANACGTTCIGSQRSGLSASIQDEKTGLLFKSDSVYDLAKSIKTILGSSAKRCQFEQEALLRAKQFNWNKTTGKFWRLIKHKARFKKEITSFQPLKSKILKNKKLPEVSILLPTQNQINLLPDCIENIKKQTYPELNIVALDNYSTDGTYQYLKQNADKVYVGSVESSKYDQVVSRLQSKYIFVAHPNCSFDEELIADCVYRLERFKTKDSVIIPFTALGQNQINRFQRVDQELLVIDRPANFFHRTHWLKNRRLGLKSIKSQYYYYVHPKLSLWQYLRQYHQLPSDLRLSLQLPSLGQLIRLIYNNPLLGINYVVYKFVLKAYCGLAKLNLGRSPVLFTQHE